MDMQKPTLKHSARYIALRTTSELEPGEYEWIETCGLENLKGRIKTADTLAKEASNTLTVALAGTAGALAYGIKLLSGEINFANLAATGGCIWLMFVSAFLVFGCLRVSPLPAVYSQPKSNLDRRKKGATFEQWQIGELYNIEDRIKDAVARNRRVGSRLNLARGLAVATPVFAVVFAYGLASLGSPLLERIPKTTPTECRTTMP